MIPTEGAIGIDMPVALFLLGVTFDEVADATSRTNCCPDTHWNS